jgi:hypothetical protein
VAGSLPFPGDDGAAVLAAVVADEPIPIHRVAPDVPRELARIIDCCLVKNPDDRVPGIAELAAMLVTVAGPAGRASFERIRELWGRPLRPLPTLAPVNVPAPEIVAASAAPTDTCDPPTLEAPAGVGGGLGRARRSLGRRLSWFAVLGGIMVLAAGSVLWGSGRARLSRDRAKSGESPPAPNSAGLHAALGEGSRQLVPTPPTAVVTAASVDGSDHAPLPPPSTTAPARGPSRGPGRAWVSSVRSGHPSSSSAVAPTASTSSSRSDPNARSPVDFEHRE